MWFTVGFTAACALGAYFFTGIGLLLLGLCFLFAAAVALCFGPKGRIAAALLFGCVIGFLWQWGYDGFYLLSARNRDDQICAVSITASDYGYSQQFGEVVDGRVILDGKTYQVRTYLHDHYDVAPGDRIEGEFRLRYTAAGGASDTTYHQSKGIFLLAYEKETPVITKAETLKLRDYPAVWRQKLLTILSQVFPSDSAGFAKALLLGDTRDITYEQNRAFQVSGIRHVVAVSGLHVSILFSLIYLFVGRNRWLVPLLGIPMLFAFAAIAGFTPSIVRACVMQALISLSMLTEREYDPPTALSFAVLVILLVNPIAVTSVGFQLSVGCMVGIFLFSENLRQYFLSLCKLNQKHKGIIEKLLRWIAGSVSVTLSAMVFTVPLCAVYFGMVSLIGILTNILTLWVISFIFYGIMLSCLLGTFWLGAARFTAEIISLPIRYVLWVSGTLAKFPLAAVYTESVYTVLWLLCTYVLLMAFFFLKKKHPGATAVYISLSLCVCVFLSCLEPRLYDTQVSVINVGQGQSILLKNEDEYYLVDCGGGDVDSAADITANYLLSQGITELDGLILTHYDSDHAGAALQLLSSIPVRMIYMPDTEDSNGLREKIELSCPEEICLISGMEILNISGGQINLYPAQVTASDNENSMCVLFQSRNCAILITGDRSSAGERKLLQEAQLPKLDILVVGHHGSHTATSHELLQITQPGIAVISVEEDNPYGYPHAEVLERLQMYGCQVYRTDQLGTIIFRR